MSTERSDAVAVKVIGSYDDPGLGDAVRDLLRIERDLEDWLREGDPARLVVVKPNWIQESHMTPFPLAESPGIAPDASNSGFLQSNYHVWN